MAAPCPRQWAASGTSLSSLAASVQLATLHDDLQRYQGDGGFPAHACRRLALRPGHWVGYQCEAESTFSLSVPSPLRLSVRAGRSYRLTFIAQLARVSRRDCA